MKFPSFTIFNEQKASSFLPDQQGSGSGTRSEHGSSHTTCPQSRLWGPACVYVPACSSDAQSRSEQGSPLREEMWRREMESNLVESKIYIMLEMLYNTFNSQLQEFGAGGNDKCNSRCESNPGVFEQVRTRKSHSGVDQNNRPWLLEWGGL